MSVSDMTFRWRPGQKLTNFRTDGTCESAELPPPDVAAVGKIDAIKEGPSVSTAAALVEVLLTLGSNHCGSPQQ